MAFCEMCGANIPDGQTRCANCEAMAARAAKKTSPIDNFGAAFSNSLGAFKTTEINWIGLASLVFMIVTLCVPFLKKTWLWEYGDISGLWYLVPIAVVGSILAYAGGILLKMEKISFVSSIVNLVCFLITWFASLGAGASNFSVGFYLWLIGVIVQLASPIGMKLFKQYVK